MVPEDVIERLHPARVLSIIFKKRNPSIMGKTGNLASKIYRETRISDPNRSETPETRRKIGP
jgi:hypothetical protein